MENIGRGLSLFSLAGFAFLDFYLWRTLGSPAEFNFEIGLLWEVFFPLFVVGIILQLFAGWRTRRAKQAAPTKIEAPK